MFEKFRKMKPLHLLKHDRKAHFSNYEMTSEFIDIGEPISLDTKTKSIQLEVRFEYWNEDVEKPSLLPRFTCSLENEGGEILFWKQMDYESLHFNLKAWNQLKVTLVLDLEDYKRLKKNNTFKYYILNSTKKVFKIRNLETKLASSN